MITITDKIVNANLGETVVGSGLCSCAIHRYSLSLIPDKRYSDWNEKVAVPRPLELQINTL